MLPTRSASSSPRRSSCRAHHHRVTPLSNAQIADLLEYSLRRFPVFDSLRNRSGHVLRPGKLHENLTDSLVAALPGLVEC